jgi:hypothetical protein
LSTLLTDLALARRLEEAEAFAAEAYARALGRRQPTADVVVEEIAGGRAVFVGAGAALTEVKAVGLHGPVTAAELDRMEDLFFRRREPVRVVVCPLADASLLEGLGRRGYRLLRFENILALPLGPVDAEPSLPPGIEVRPSTPEEAGLYARVVAPNFVGPGETVEGAMEMMAIMLEMAHAVPFLAFLDGQPVGGGALLLHRGLALLAGAATLPPYRKRGVHAALHHVRLAHARRCGCDLAAQGAEPGSTSQRNAERRGLRVVYTRALLIREPP